MHSKYLHYTLYKSASSKVFVSHFDIELLNMHLNPFKLMEHARPSLTLLQFCFRHVGYVCLSTWAFQRSSLGQSSRWHLASSTVKMLGRPMTAPVSAATKQTLTRTTVWQFYLWC